MRKHLVRNIFLAIGGVGVFLLLSMIFLFIYFNLPGAAPRKEIALGMAFSSRYATDLDLDWQETYLAPLDDIGIKKMRIPVYWYLVEPASGEYDFSKIDWQLEEARKRNVEV